jgi:hypothetical protein
MWLALDESCTDNQRRGHDLLIRAEALHHRRLLHRDNAHVRSLHKHTVPRGQCTCKEFAQAYCATWCCVSWEKPLEHGQNCRQSSVRLCVSNISPDYDHFIDTASANLICRSGTIMPLSACA